MEHTMEQFSSRRLMALGSGLLVSLAACGDSSTAPGGESEVISRVTLTLTPASGPALTTYIDDADGSGPTAPSAQVAIPALVRGVTYTGTVRFENRLVNPVEDITAEVQKESNEHRVFFTVTGTGVTVTTTDNDGQGRPLGLRFTKAVASTATAGTTRVVLCHYDDSPKVASATSCTGDTDIDVTFAHTIAP
ncbi:hypothetical protein [Gemmatimonas sp.]|uniref:hypothetical protein n=1 Tax=Gemmatimonas sp. TaxID=1962908 RepID=UPI0025C00451|nr:hypothetical protein [Gemmatimonas sp.]MCA2992715.1 type 1 periplasmic binding fold superfamily protein [Gemmatimonas sp.]